MTSMSDSFNGSSYAASVASSRSSASVRARAEREHQERHGEDLLERRSPLENGIFGVLFTLSKENSETRIRIRWTLLKILLDAWQLFTTVISPAKQGWNIKPKGTYVVPGRGWLSACSTSLGYPGCCFLEQAARPIEFMPYYSTFGSCELTLGYCSNCRNSLFELLPARIQLTRNIRGAQPAYGHVPAQQGLSTGTCLVTKACTCARALFCVIGISLHVWLLHQSIRPYSPWLVGCQGYGAYLAVLYSMVALLMGNVGLCVWVAWCFKEHKFPVVWPIKVLRVFSSVFFQAFDVASLNLLQTVTIHAFNPGGRLSLLQLGISCNYSGNGGRRLHMDLFPSYSCTSTPHVLHAVVSALSLVLFVAIALLLNMAEVEVNPLSRRPLALGHSGAEVMAFAFKPHSKAADGMCTATCFGNDIPVRYELVRVTCPEPLHAPLIGTDAYSSGDLGCCSKHVLLTLVDVFVGYKRVAACLYTALSLALAWQSLRRNPHLVAWVNYLKGGVAATILWCCVSLVLLVFQPGIHADRAQEWSESLTLLMLVGLGPAFGVGALTSFLVIRSMTMSALKALATARPDVRLEDVCENLDDPRDVEIVARCCRVWKDRYTVDADAVNRAHQVIKAGLAMFPTSAYMVLLHGNFMIDVLGVSQSGSSRIEDARKLNPSLMCRFIMFVRHQQATQKAAGNSANDGTNMDLLGYVEYQRKQRMVVRLHREALQAMCNFWKALDASRVSFMHLSRALSRIESSVSQAQTAYRVVLESYSHNPKLVRLYGKFLQTIKNDPWRASEYFAEADRLEEIKNGDARGPLLPDGTPLGRMDEMATAVLVLNAAADVQMANRHTHVLFGYKRGTLEGKPLATLLAPHTIRRVTEKLAALAGATSVTGALISTMSITSNDAEAFEDVVVGMHYDRLAFPVKFYLRKISGVGEDSTFVVMLEPVQQASGVATLWVAPNGTVAACDPQFVSQYGWRPSEVNGSNLAAFLAVVAPEKRQQQAPARDGEAAPAALLDSTGDVMERLLSGVSAATDDPNAEQHGGVKCHLAHKYDTEAMPCTASVTSNINADIPMLEIRIQMDRAPAQILVTNRRGTIVHASLGLVTAFKDVARGGVPASKFGYSGGGGLGGASGGFSHGGGGGGGVGGRFAGGASALLSGQAGSTLGAVPGADELLGFTLFDFMPAPWKDMHMKFLKDTAATSSPASRNHWSCRKVSLPGPTLELRTAGGKPLYMNVCVSSMDTAAGESTHVIRLARSSLETALAERRLRLGVTEDGLVSQVSEGAAKLFGLEPGKIIGRGLWEIIEEVTPEEGGRQATPGPRMLTALVTRSLASPDHSWRVLVSPPRKPSAPNKGGMLELAAAARASLVKSAIMQGQLILGGHYRVRGSVIALMTPPVAQRPSTRPSFHPSTRPHFQTSFCLPALPATWVLQTAPHCLCLDDTCTLCGGVPIRCIARVRWPPHPFDGLHLRVQVEYVAKTQEGIGGGDDDEAINIFVDLWPIATVTGLLELDGNGRVRTVLEERIRPAGLLFGLATQALVGCMLGDLVVMPPGRLRPGDLLSSSNMKKSSLKSTKREYSVKVGPVHVLQANHADGRPALLDVQVVGKPGFNQPVHAILRFHLAPMLPGAPRARTSATGAAAGVASTAPRATAFSLRASSMARMQSSGDAAMAAAAAAALGFKLDAMGPLARAESPRTLPPRSSFALKEPSSGSGVGGGGGGGNKLGRSETTGRKVGVAALTLAEEPAAALPSSGMRSLMSDRAAAAAMLPLEEVMQTGYSVAADHQGPVGLAAAPPDMLTEGMPQPGVTASAGKAAQLAAGRSKLADMVKSVGSGSARGGGGSPGDLVKTPPRHGSSRPPTHRMPSGVSLPKSPISETGGNLDELLMRATTKGVGLGAAALATAGDCCPHQYGLRQRLISNPLEIAMEAAAARTRNLEESDWTAPIGFPHGWPAKASVYYQNTVKPDVPSDDDKSRRSADFSDGAPGNDVVVRVHMDDFGTPPDLVPRRAVSPGMRSDFAGYGEEDAASEGGQSAMSAQSANGGAEYKRGKRFRKLIKLMDSSQTQQVRLGYLGASDGCLVGFRHVPRLHAVHGDDTVQQRFRTHALATVAFLALVHIVCFALVVTAIQSQRSAMLNLGRSGEAQRNMHQMGAASMGAASMGAASMGAASMGAASMGAASMGAASMGAASMGAASMGAASMGAASMGAASMGAASMGAASMGAASMGAASMGAASMGAA
ncbi:hypothetical protein VOLCADRAFT_94559 [Volvox carteri f. nagariensis]|uniref:PAS domain-containing protein n=1 Tax=Volvox carteri f. nagariensis TaxID=3068 RepID=D8U541_VOLCA|nr:uncharacterized protein VOLCADRAFT_94559 [Volvox carteri f. nagariensis]EFJ45151.1 hypothetical protein VOLCADRAFT_94559 [Volvox carteri f. nagariensis]|eukprot:XP_002953827.1 hypothetical protein VOLCADRAFT_94559 [Volvox carteri f. nagariensis]